MSRPLQIKLPVAPHPDCLKPEMAGKWQHIVANIYSALYGKLCLIAEEDGVYYAIVTDIEIAVPDCVKQNAKIACEFLSERTPKSRRVPVN